MDQLHFFSLAPDELRKHMDQWNMPSFRADQLFQWVYKHGVVQLEHMTNLPAGERKTLAEKLVFITGKTIKRQLATDKTKKLLLQWPSQPEADASKWQTECVMIPATSRDSGRQRRTACVSSQVGCAVGCKFCASGLGGLDGNLTAGQIVEQAYQLSHLDQGKPITNVVFMGMGEPLANFGPVTKAATIMTQPWGMNLSGRHITISTVGLPAQIRRLAKLNITATLAISLHAPNDQLRREIIPWAEFVSIDQLIDAGKAYFEQTGREITLEYILLASINDQPQHAKELAIVCKKLRANINLIRYNEVKTLAYHRPRNQDVRQFQSILQQAGCNVHIRASRGRDIAAACGQLRYENKQPPQAR